MRIKCLTLSIMMLAVIFPGLCPGRSQEQRAGRQIEIEKYWNGEAKIELRNLAPPEGFIANEKAWAELWKAYTGNEEFPKIDFDKHLILVVAGDDPNNIVINPDTLTLDEYGDLKPGHIQTAIGFENPKTFKYQFVLISLKGVKSINGKPIDSVNHEMN